MDGAGAQDGRDELLGVAVEDEQRMVDVLAVVAVVGAALLIAVGGVVGAVEVEQDALGRAGVLALAQVEQGKRLSQTDAGVAVDRVLHPGEGGLAGEVVAVDGALSAGQLEEGSERRVSASSWSA